MKSQANSSRKSVSNTRTSGENKKIDKIKRYGNQEDEHAEIKAYLSKLQALVLFAPKNKKLSKLAVISNVIDYIHDLRETLGLQPCNAALDMDSMSQCGNVQYTSDIEISDNIASTNLSPISSLPSGILQCSPVLTQPIQNNRLPLGVISNPT